MCVMHLICLIRDQRLRSLIIDHDPPKFFEQQLLHSKGVEEILSALNSSQKEAILKVRIVVLHLCNLQNFCCHIGE